MREQKNYANFFGVSIFRDDIRLGSQNELLLLWLL